MRAVLKTFDPGLVRLEQTLKCGLAMAAALVATWLVMAALPTPLAAAEAAAAAIFSLIVAFVCFLVAAEPLASARKRTLLLCVPLFIAAPFVAGLVQPYSWAAAVLLLTLMFLSFYVRRNGVRAAELGLTALFAYYFSLLFGATLATAPWFALGAFIGGAAALICQFIILPYDPHRYLRRGMDAFLGCANAILAGSTERPALQQLHAAHGAVLAQLPGVADDPAWPALRVSELKLALFRVRQGLDRLAATGRQAEDLDQSLTVLHEALLRAEGPQQGPQPEAKLLPLQPTKPGDARQPGAPAPPSRRLHPTTVLGIQAVLACALAMGLSLLLNLDRPYWAFWTAYIVVAGPSGESLQKLIFRVVGITLGALFGTLLVVALPGAIWLSVVLQLSALMLVFYTRVINYAWMAFWITTFVALMYGVEGVPPETVLIVRPLNTLLGATIAALVVIFVLPIREETKLRPLLLSFLNAADAYVQLLMQRTPGKPGVEVTNGAMRAAGAYAAVAQTFPALQLEINPLQREHRGALPAGIEELDAAVEQLANYMAGAQTALDAAVHPDVDGMLSTIHANFAALTASAAGKPADLQPPTAPNLQPQQPESGVEGCLQHILLAQLQLASVLDLRAD